MKCTRRSPLATRSLAAPNSGLRRRADERPTPGSNARPRLPLPACCPPPSPPGWRRGPLARGCWYPRLPPRLRWRLLARGCLRVPSPPRWRRGPLARGCWCPRLPPRLRRRMLARGFWCPRLPPRLRWRLLARGCRCVPSPPRWSRGPLARACRCPPSPTRLRRAPCARQFRGAVGWVLATFSTRRGLWSRRWRPLAWTRGRRTLRRARRWAGGEAAAQGRHLARLCVVRRRVLAAGKGRLCAPRNT